MNIWLLPPPISIWFMDAPYTVLPPRKHTNCIEKTIDNSPTFHKKPIYYQGQNGLLTQEWADF